MTYKIVANKKGISLHMSCMPCKFQKNFKGVCAATLIKMSYLSYSVTTGEEVIVAK